MNFFDVLNSILFSKKNTFENLDTENFNLYMMNRWISMYSPELASMVNFTTNRFGQVLDTQESQYSLLLNIFPKTKYKKLNYLKKKKEPKKQTTDNISVLAKNKELSQREIQMYYSFLS
jgi:hypothetical protein